jgi:hypothetical protein
VLQYGALAERAAGDVLEVEGQRVGDDLAQPAHADVDAGDPAAGGMADDGGDDRGAHRKLVHGYPA